MSLAQLREVNGITLRDRGTPPLLVVPMNGATINTARLPIMYAPPIPVRGPRNVVHTVKQGETLATIAGNYRVSVDDLRRWNKVGRVAAGQKLTIQGSGGSRTASKGRTAGKPGKAKPRPGSTKKIVNKSK